MMGRAGIKFDAGQVVALARSFNQVRSIGSESASQSIDDVSRFFLEHGLVVRQEALLPRNEKRYLLFFPRLLIFLLASFSMFLSINAAFHAEMPFGFIGLFCFYFVEGSIKRNGRLHSPSLTAMLTGVSNQRARIVFVTGLLTPRRVRTSLRNVFLLVLVLGLGFLGKISWVKALLDDSPNLLCIFYTAHVVAITLLVVSAFSPHESRPFRGDNRTGIALLMELARNWPPSISDRLETLFVLSPLPKDVARRFVDEKPTLVIVLDAPGVGHSLKVVGSEWVETAIKDLWITARYVFGIGKHGGPEEVVIAGSHDDSAIDPAAFERLAQLITELSLRWAKQSQP